MAAGGDLDSATSITLPSEQPGATKKHGYLVSGTGSRVFTNGTVTPGKTLYVTDLVISAFNSGTANGDLRIRDGAAGAEKWPSVFPSASLTETSLATQPLTAVPISLNEPLEFTTSVAVDVVAGTITYGGFFTGYEK